MVYKHGVFGSIEPSTDTLPPAGVGTLPVYIGTAPVQQLANPAAAVNVPIVINNFDDAAAKIGYSDDWKTFTLCEVVYAHFKNKVQPIGPIIVINIMDPTVHSSVGTSSVAITNGVGYITDQAILSTIAITGKVKGTDYKAEYLPDGRVKLTSLTGQTLVNPTSATYNKMDATVVTDADIIGGNLGGIRTGIAVADLIYQTLNQVPTILAAPGWSHHKLIKEALITRAHKINGHWDAVVLADLNVDSTADTITEAIAWKSTNDYSDVPLKVGWPKAEVSGHQFWASTIMGVRMQQTDYANDNVPYESPSNKRVDITSTVLGSGAKIQFDEVQANELNAKGITTFNFRDGMWVLWGPHNANYEYGTDIDPENVFDSSIRMLRYLTNSFQSRYGKDVDDPLNRSKVDTILNDCGVWLSGLIADGKLLSASISFNETSNPTSSIVEGDFVFDILTTTTPVAKSLTFKVRYTTAGLSALFGGGES
ncbi:phage tail sheath family protein [Paenibacillus sp. NPDC058367]|uniref:phage tail sheath family protein n=1 Tax=Paenibacillus sp. NPDC058367 TaxID=3346460 RepID=UPI0036576FF0